MNTVDVRVLTVKFNNAKNCFVSLPRNWNLREKECPVLLEVELTSSGVKCHVTWAGHRCADEQLAISGLYGNRLGLADSHEVLVKVLTPTFTSSCTQATVQPLSTDDWELMSLNASTVESGLIHQIRCIWSGMIFPVWVSGGICLFVKVGSVSPAVCPVLLQEHTEVVVMPPRNDSLSRRHTVPRNTGNQRVERSSSLRKERSKKEVTRTGSVNQILTAFGSAVMNVFTPLSPSTRDESPDFMAQTSSSETLQDISVALDFKVLSLREILHERSMVESGHLPPTTVFISESSFGEGGSDLPDFFLCYMSKLLSPSEKMAVNKAQEEKPVEKLYKTEKEVVRVILVRDFSEHPLPWRLKVLGPGCVAVPDLLRRQMGLEILSKVWIHSIDHSHETSTPTIVLHPLSLQLSQSEEKMTESFRNWMSSLRMPLATSGRGTLVHFPKDGGTDLVLKVESPSLEAKAYWILRGPVSNVKFGQKVSPQHTLWGAQLPCKLETLEMKFKVTRPKLDDLGGVRPVSREVLGWLELSLRLSPLSIRVCMDSGSGVPCLLLCGPKGVGKTAFCQAICQQLQSWRGHIIHTVMLSCRNLRGKRVETLRKTWQMELSECIHRQPSLLVLDDLDLLASAPTGPEGEAGFDALYFSRIAQTLISLQDTVQDSRVVLMATSKSVQSLHSKLSSSRGRHFFSKVVHLKPPDIEQRQEILRSLVDTKAHLSDESLSNISLDRLAAMTDGYVAQDLEMLVDRATHAAFLNEANVGMRCSHRVLCDDSFEVALQDFRPSSLYGLALHSDPTRSWDDLGGLAQVKEALLRTLIWPLKYPKLFAQSPLRVQSGVLLYGAPGTGKTLLAGILATEAGLNFISIKGPELLSKYIGASEQAVRDLFQRAQSARPCILFFDEFDAIAPRRGHDSTGVTDRVVNQFLTQMDGVEALSGVYVLAASSRPDLIDPALLRPGRIDKCLHCPLPQESEREEIIYCLSRRLHMDLEVDLPSLARETDQYSGADLQALLYSAQLEALHDFQRQKACGVRTQVEANLSFGDVIYFPTLEDGPRNLEEEKDRDDIMQHMERISEKSMSYRGSSRRETPSSRQRRKSSMMAPCINQSHLLKSLEQTRQSVLSRDRSKFTRIYEEFQRWRDGGEFHQLPPGQEEPRATLA